MRATYLAQVPRDPHVVPAVVVEVAGGGLHEGLEGPGAQVDHQPQGPVPQGQVDVVGRAARVQQQPVALPRAEGQRDLVQAALDGRLRQVVAEELVAPEGGHRLSLAWEDPGRGETHISNGRPRFVSPLGSRSDPDPKGLTKQWAAPLSETCFPPVLAWGPPGEHVSRGPSL